MSNANVNRTSIIERRTVKVGKFFWRPNPHALEALPFVIPAQCMGQSEAIMTLTPYGSIDHNTCPKYSFSLASLTPISPVHQQAG